MEIKLDYYAFGPFLVRTEVTDSLIKDINSKAKKATEEKNRYNRNLAGQIENEYKFEKEDKDDLQEKIKPYIVSYLETFSTHWVINGHNSNLHDTFRNELEICLDSIWINYQRKGEYNPPHSHSGDISFVIYNDVPDVIAKEKRFGTGLNPGAIEFLYTLSNYYHIREEDNTNLAYHLRETMMPRNSMIFQPVTGEMLIFPSYLHHHVARFNSDVVRQSVAGNITFKHKVKK